MAEEGNKTEKELSLSTQSNPYMYLFRCWALSAFQHNTYELHIIAFGNGMKGKDGVRIKVQQVSITGVLFSELKQRQKEGMLLMVYIDGFNTSKVRFT